jgi:hypothetical protein
MKWLRFEVYRQWYAFQQQKRGVGGRRVDQCWFLARFFAVSMIQWFANISYLKAVFLVNIF